MSIENDTAYINDDEPVGVIPQNIKSEKFTTSKHRKLRYFLFYILIFFVNRYNVDKFTYFVILFLVSF
jgi:hypothetical protein